MRQVKLRRALRFTPCVFILLIFTGCSLEIFSDFSVVSVSIPENGVIGTDTQEIEIVFSKSIDESSVETNTRIESDSSGEVSLSYTVSGTRLCITPDEAWAPHERYWLIIAKEIKDTFGKTMGKGFYHPFQSTQDLLPVSAVLLFPHIKDGIVTEETASFQIGFSGDVEKNSVERQFSPSPDVEGFFEWASDSSFSYHLTDALKKNSFYTLQISEDADDQDGFGIQSFRKEFEYFPNQDFPQIEAVTAGGTDIFRMAATATWTLEDGCYVAEYPEAEKDIVLRIDFSAAIDRTTFKENFEVSPFAEWHELWIDDDIVEVSFDEDLRIDEYYEIIFKKSIEDVQGLSLQNKYIINLRVNGDYSRYMKLYADYFDDLHIEDVELWLNAVKVISGVEAVSFEAPEENNNEGYAVVIDYNAGLIQQDDVPDIEVRWNLELRFSSPAYTPEIEQLSLQDSLQFELVFGNDTLPGSIFSFQWLDTNVCKVNMRDIGAGNVYRFVLEGGNNGVVDELRNYMKEDIEYCFKVKLVSN